MIRYCARPTTVPIISDSSDETSSRFFQTSNGTPFIISVRDDPLRPSPLCSSSRNTKIEILGITASHVVTIVGTPSYTSGDQLWNGAADTLNRNPTTRIVRPIAQGPRSVVRLSILATDRIEKISSRFVRPVNA